MSTCDKLNGQIRQQTISSLKTYLGSDPTVLSERIRQLDREWDVERVLESGAGSLMLAGSLLGYRKSRCCWFLFTGTVGFFLLQHALQGWCPPLPAARAKGVRTAEEIGAEKTVLKRMRGDFAEDTADADSMLTQAEKQ